MMTAKENQIAMYSHQKIDHMPAPMEGEHCVYPVLGFTENPTVASGKDWFGANWIFETTANATAPDPRNHVMDDICDWRDVVQFPDLDAWDWEKAVELDHINEIDRENKMVNVVILIGLFERLHVLMGFEDALCALMTDPEEVEAFFDAMVEHKIKLIDKLCEYYKPDLITFHDDWGTQNGPFFSPDLWRQMIKPRMKKIIDHAHEKGLIFLLHSCGKYDEIIPEIEEIGVDTLQCMDINDISRALENTKGNMSFQVSVHTQAYYAADAAGTLTEEAVREQVSKEFREWGKSGRYFPCIFFPSTWYEEVVMDEYLKASKELAGTYTK